MDQIIVVCCSEDGNVNMQVMPESAFLSKLNGGQFGLPPVILNWDSDFDKYNYADLQGRAGIYVIRGKFVTPKPAQVVTEYTL